MAKSLLDRIQGLPEELQLKILRYLSTNDIVVNVRNFNPHFGRLIQDRSLWTKIYITQKTLNFALTQLRDPAKMARMESITVKYRRSLREPDVLSDTLLEFDWRPLPNLKKLVVVQYQSSLMTAMGWILIDEILMKGGVDDKNWKRDCTVQNGYVFQVAKRM